MVERVNYGEWYWYIHGTNYLGKFCILRRMDVRDTIDDDCYELGNYFHTEEEAESMAEKIRKVLKGADVIEVPSKPLGLTDIKNHHLRGYVPERLSINDLKAFALGFWEGCDWLASKIVK